MDKFSIPFMPLGCPAGHTGKISWCVGRAWDWRTRFPETRINLVLRSVSLLQRKAHIGKLILEEAFPASGGGGRQAVTPAPPRPRKIQRDSVALAIFSV